MEDLYSSNIDNELYEPKKVAGNEFDCIVIGSGIGGLSAASLLAGNGSQKVLVLEQHSTAGGCCHTFELNGYRFGTGIHYCGELEENDVEKGLCRVIYDNLTRDDDPIVWDRMDENYETVVIGDTRYEIWASREMFKQKLLEKFPEEEEALEKYLKLTDEAPGSWLGAIAMKTLPLPLARVLVCTGLDRFVAKGWRKSVNTTVKERLEKLTDNKDLQAVLACNWGDYGVWPSRAPSFFQPLVTKHFLNGAYYPHDGPSMIPKKIIRRIVDRGGKVLVSAKVKRIVIDDKTKAAIGVEMQDGEVIKAKTVVSDAGLINTATKLLPPGRVKVNVVKEDDYRLRPSVTGISLFVGLKGDPIEIGLPTSIMWINPSNDLSAAAEKLMGMSLDEALELDPRSIPIFVGAPCTKDKAWSERYPNRSALEIITVAPWHWFEKFESAGDDNTLKDEYSAAKKILAEKMWTRTVEVLERAKLPKTLDEVDCFELGTPLTFARFFNSEEGAWYGLDMNKGRFKPTNFFLRLRPEIPEVPGLFLTGQDVTADGLGAAAMGGLLCVSKVLHRSNPFSLLHNVPASDGTGIAKKGRQVRPTTNPTEDVEG